MFSEQGNTYLIPVSISPPPSVCFKFVSDWQTYSVTIFGPKTLLDTIEVIFKW